MVTRAQIEKIKIILEGEDKASDDIERVDKKTKKLNKSVGGLAKKFAGTLGLTVSVGAAVAMFRTFDKQLETNANNIAKEARALDISSEAYQKYVFAAELATKGGSGELNRSLQILQKNLFLIKTGAGEDARRGLEVLGIEATDAAGDVKRVDDVFEEILKKYPLVQNSTERTAALMTLLGRSGNELRLLFEGGIEGIAETGDDLDRLGGVLSDEYLTGAENAIDATSRLSKAFGGLFSRLTTGSKGGVTDLKNAVAGLVGELNNLIDLDRDVEAFFERRSIIAQRGGAVPASRDLFDSFQIPGSGAVTTGPNPPPAATADEIAAAAAERLEAKYGGAAGLFRSLDSFIAAGRRTSFGAVGPLEAGGQLEVQDVGKDLEIMQSEVVQLADSTLDYRLQLDFARGALRGLTTDVDKLGDAMRAALIKIASQAAESLFSSLPFIGPAASVLGSVGGGGSGGGGGGGGGGGVLLHEPDVIGPTRQAYSERASRSAQIARRRGGVY